MQVRLQKYMAGCGVGSRRKCEELIKNGRVSVDGIIIKEMGVKIIPLVNTVEMDGNILTPCEKKVYVALNKPVGCITSSDEQFGRDTVLDYVKDINERVFPVGRLDYNSSGLLFITNDGDFAYRLTHPKHNIEKVYYVKVMGVPSEAELKTLRDGVLLDDGITFPAQVQLTDNNPKTPSLTITVTEGRNRLVRRMFDAVGHSVLSLHRISVGGVSLGGLKEGEYRFLSEEELKQLTEGY